MSETTTTKTAAPELGATAPATTVVTKQAPPPDTSAVVDRAVAAEAAAKEARQKLAAIEAEKKTAARKAAEAAKQAESDALKQRLEQAEAEAAKFRSATTQTLARQHLDGIKDFDTFFPMVRDRVDLAEDGNLTEESAQALAAFREQHAYLFDRPSGSTPVSQTSHRPAAGQFSAEDAEAITLVTGRAPGKWKESPQAQSPAARLVFGGLMGGK